MPIVVQCPFFSKEVGLKTNCEGGAIKHPDKTARKDYMLTYCASDIGWKKCTLAKSLNNYYDRKDEENE